MRPKAEASGTPGWEKGGGWGGQSPDKCTAVMRGQLRTKLILNNKVTLNNIEPTHRNSARTQVYGIRSVHCLKDGGRGEILPDIQLTPHSPRHRRDASSLSLQTQCGLQQPLFPKASCPLTHPCVCTTCCVSTFRYRHSGLLGTQSNWGTKLSSLLCSLQGIQAQSLPPFLVLCRCC